MLRPDYIAGAAWVLWGAYWLIASRAVKSDAKAEATSTRLPHLAALVIGFTLTFSEVPLPLLHDGALPVAVMWAGVALTVASVAFAAWGRVHLGANWSARITLKEGHQVIRTGPYALVRHPIYTGVIFGSVGAALASGHLGHLAGPAVIMLAYAVKIRREEAVLVAELPGYAEYRTSVRALVPFVF